MNALQIQRVALDRGYRFMGDERNGGAIAFAPSRSSRYTVMYSVSQLERGSRQRRRIKVGRLKAQAQGLEKERQALEHDLASSN